MKKRIIQTAISLTALVASFLPQKAEACTATCTDNDGEVNSCTGNLICGCVNGIAICINWP